MLAMNSYYSEAYVQACRARMKAQLAAYKTLLRSVEEKPVAAFEQLFLANLVLVLDHFFVHRTRALEGKDGNALNEVRMLYDSILLNDSVMTANKTIKYDPARSVLKIAIGQRIKLTAADFARLFDGFFAEIETKFMK